jgi:ABC-type glycerol-3-phosphate transport system substrate-binding protein
LGGYVTVWHGWSPAEERVLQESLRQYEEIHPNVRVVAVAISKEQLLDEFRAAGRRGVSPDLLLGSSSWIDELVNNGLIRPLSSDEDLLVASNSQYGSLTRYEDQLYGLPLFLAPQALYYNKSMVSQPAQTLDDLLKDAEDGNRVAFVPRFEPAYWGIQAFGEGLFDAEGRFTLAESGFSEWLAWLNKTEDTPGVILSTDTESLVELFATEEIAYYVAGPDSMANISALMGEEAPFEIGIVPLPRGPHGPAGPLLTAEALLFNAFTSPVKTSVVDDLAAFLANQQQGIRFMRELGKTPANPGITVDRRIYPQANGFARQARTAVALPHEIPSEPLAAAGDRAYRRVLTGVLSAEEAVCQFGNEVAAFQGYSVSDMSLPEGCEFMP